jgi:hypothetical protein
MHCAPQEAKELGSSEGVRAPLEALGALLGDIAM